MNAASPRSFPLADSLPRQKSDTGAAQKSWSNVLPQSFGPAARDLAGSDAHTRARELAARRQVAVAGEAFRNWFAPAFARWLQINFSDAEAVVSTFGVRYQTALNWWNAAHRASGDTVALVFIAFPHAVAWFLGEWEAGR